MFSSRKNSANSREYQLNPKSGNERYSVFQIFPPNLVTLEWPELQTSDPNYQLTRITPSYPIYIVDWDNGTIACNIDFKNALNVQ